MTESQREAERAEAMNPGTTPERLAALAAHHGEAVLANPALALLLVERPDWWGGLSKRAQENMAYWPAVRAEFAEWVLRAKAADGQVWVVLLGNERLPAALRRRVLLERPGELGLQLTEASQLAHAGVLTQAELLLLVRAGASELPQLGRSSYARHGVMTAAEVEQLSGIGNIGRLLALHHPECPAALKERLRAT